MKNKANLYEKYCQRVEGVRIVQDDGSNRIKYCLECNIEKILIVSESAYICSCCGDTEDIIFDEGRQIKDYWRKLLNLAHEGSVVGHHSSSL
jgi:hypothetical protein